MYKRKADAKQFYILKNKPSPFIDRKGKVDA